jgi:hypothetical protein
MIRACFDPPWCVRVEDRAPLTVMLVVRGEAWVVPDAGERLYLRAGDLAIARGQDLDVRTWGDRLDGSTVPLIGTYMMEGEIHGRLS